MIRIEAHRPNGQTEGKTLNIELGICRDVLEAARIHFVKVPIENSPVIFTREACYKRNEGEGKMIKCYNEEHKSSFFVDCEDGKSVSKKVWINYCFRFYQPSAKLPPLHSWPNYLPQFFVKSEVEFHTINSQRQIQIAQPEIISDPSFVVLLFGLKSRSKLYWETSNLQYIDSVSGMVFQIDDIRKDANKSFVFLLLRNGDPVPQVKFKKIKAMIVLRRCGVQLWMRNGCVQCAGDPDVANFDTWQLPMVADDFMNDFMDAAGKK